MIKLIKAARLRVRNHLKNLRKDRKGAAALEYALLTAVMAVSVIGGATSFGHALANRMANMGGMVETGSVTGFVPTPSATPTGF